MAEKAAASKPWTVVEVAEDLLAQLEDAQAAGWARDEAVQTLQVQGIEDKTGGDLWDEVQAAAAKAGRADDTLTEAQLQQVMIDVTPCARWIRTPGDPLTVDGERVEQLGAALHKAGILSATARSFVSELAAHERLLLEVYQQRMRRLGLQGMVGGGLFTAFFVWSALAVGGTAYWHLTTATATALLTAYSVLLYRNGRKPRLFS